MELSKEQFREEVTRFRASFKEDALSSAEKNLTLEKRGDVGLIVFDQYQEKANKLSTPNMLRLFELLTQIEADDSIRSVVILSRKPTIFIAGADISEIERMQRGEADVAALMKLQAVFTYLERLPKPTIAAIHGACMGGGTELALACDYRMVTDAPETRIALPEVQLGVLPGWGGTQRLPRLLGLEKSLGMILTGAPVDGKKAKKIGLADKVSSKEWLEEKALAWAAELGKADGKRDKSAAIKERMLEMVPGGKWMIFDQARKQLMSKTKGLYPAPLRALEVVRKTYGGNLEAGLRIEAEAFGDLVRTPESESLIHVYYLTERVKKDKGAQATAAEIHKAAVLGAGVMGGGVAQLFAAKGIRVRMKDVTWDAIAKGYKAAKRIFAKQVERRKLKPNEFDNAMARIEGTTSYQGFKSIDLVVEAVVENLDVKKKVFQELEASVNDRCVLATNTSSLSVTEIASATKNPKRVVGMHFFNPVDKMPLVEVIRGRDTSDEAVATTFQLAKRLGKTPIVVKDGPGFVVNRILGPYLNEAMYLLSEGAPIGTIDHTMEQFGMPMGPCTLLDEIGLDVAAKVCKILHAAFGERMKPPAVIEKLGKDGRLGKKSNKGLYLYNESGKRQGPDSSFVQSLVESDISKSIPSETIQKRLTYVMINEAARCVEEGLVRDVADVDIGMIFGTGFAPFRGGLLKYADRVGPEAVVSELEVLSRTFGARFQPASFLQQLAVSNKKFYA